jgi:adenylate kinase
VTGLVIFLVGPPGAGKSTISDLLAHATDGHAVHSSAILRKLMKQTPDSKTRETVAYHLVSSEPVSDDIYMQALCIELADTQTQTLVFDGYPKSVPQSQAILSMLGELGFDSSHVVGIVLEASATTLEMRTGRRQVCLNCENPLDGDRQCCPQPKAGRRADDAGDHLLARTAEFYQSIQAISADFTQHWPLRSVNADGPPKTVVQLITTAIHCQISCQDPPTMPSNSR